MVNTGVGSIPRPFKIALSRSAKPCPFSSCTFPGHRNGTYNSCIRLGQILQWDRLSKAFRAPGAGCLRNRIQEVSLHSKAKNPRWSGCGHQKIFPHRRASSRRRWAESGLHFRMRASATWGISRSRIAASLAPRKFGIRRAGRNGKAQYLLLSHSRRDIRRNPSLDRSPFRSVSIVTCSL